MKKIIVCFLLFYSISDSVFSQDSLTIYYNKNWEEISNKNLGRELAVFYRKAIKQSNDTWKVTDYYLDSNRIQMTGFYPNKKFKSKEGHFVYYFNNGQKQSEGEYVDDEASGVWTGWNKEGVQISEGLFDKGNLDGVWNYWHDNGEAKSKGLYISGKAHGKWEYWDEKGQKKSIGTYANDQRDGDWKYFHKNGKDQTVEHYANGKIISLENYYDNGIMQSKGNYLNEKENGKWTYWNRAGKITLEGTYVNGLKDGEWTKSFKEGNMKITYKNGQEQNKILGGVITN